jgi:hypothetical protein
MSRGPGDLQRAIIKFVAIATVPVTVESMRWDLCDQLGKPAVLPGKELPPEWNTSFSRAVKKLASDSRKLITIERRPLESLEECIRHYPGKSLQVDVRRQRQELLPALLEWTQEKYGASPHYSLGQNEEYFVERLSESRRRWLRNEWGKLELLIRPRFADSGSRQLLLLFAKARALFCGLNVKSPFSFADIVKKSCAELSPELADQLRRFAKGFLSDTSAGALQLKSYVHKFANVPRHGRCSLRKDTLEALHRRRPTFVEAMPGFRSRRSRFWREPQYPPALHKLFDQTVFQSFQFVGPAA